MKRVQVIKEIDKRELELSEGLEDHIKKEMFLLLGRHLHKENILEVEEHEDYPDIIRSNWKEFRLECFIGTKEEYKKIMEELFYIRGIVGCSNVSAVDRIVKLLSE